jgi:epoxyqueuosine reductase
MPAPVPSLVSAQVRQEAERLGFLAAGVASLGPSLHGEELDDWLARGFGGTMRYLHRQVKRRKEPGRIMPRAKVAVVVLENYGTEAAGLPRPLRGLAMTADLEARGLAMTAPVKIAGYARGEDYHRALMRRLGQLAGFLMYHGATVAHPWADSGPVPERELAHRAGLGWIGKNTMLIRPGVGSFFFIGTVFTDLDLAPDAPFETDHCGSCTACLEACPTGALVEPRLLDATRCISYLTIESRQPVPADLAAKMGGWAFGCDVCNDVCPWNERFARPTERPEYQPRPEPDGADPDYFANLTEEEFERRFGDTPLARPGLVRMRRNWRLAFGMGRRER